MGFVLALGVYKGSSPLTRGKVYSQIQSHAASGIIPAYAGKRSVTVMVQSLTEDHPRLRGEKGGRTDVRWQKEGSSPLTRGKGRDRVVTISPKRIIPAYAGKRYLLYRLFVICGDHPRLRGEKWAVTSSVMRRKGSSPLTRGKGVPCPWFEAWQGIIPAYAGKRRRA